ncbi:hypothetical protein [Abyssalbus ytuae]|uniref:Uncharacterized protein n=1 Tax=Abyssalbus ytuae TaxID=2926907 RepID=A0A9E6ZML8_9FLAO|nr:hypothetical protein [Abyssalbus ytuae]UOB18617.1 hypothetical protein MQE35_04840 [Abyssalbus ytuae]
MEQLKESEKFIGFSNIRKFWFAIGKPITMLYYGFLLAYVTSYINDRTLKKAMYISSMILLLISIYFVTWTLWYRQDFPENLYYITIGVISVVSAFASYYLISHRNNLAIKIQYLVNFISKKIYTRYIADQDKKEFVNESLQLYKEKILDE